MMPPDALQGWAPWFGQWCSFAISSLRWARSTYPFRARCFDAVQPVPVRLELVDRLPEELRRGEDGNVVLRARFEDGAHATPPLSVAEEVVVDDERADVRGPQDPDEVGEGPLRVDLRIVFRHVRHRSVHVEDRWLGVDQEREVFLQGRTDYVGGVDEHVAPVRDPGHHDVPELVVVTVRHRRREQELGAAKVHLVPVGHLDRLRIRLQLADESAGPFPLASIDVEAPFPERRVITNPTRIRPRPYLSGGRAS